MFNVKTLCPFITKFFIQFNQALATLPGTSEKTKLDKFSLVLVNLWAIAFNKASANPGLPVNHGPSASCPRPKRIVSVRASVSNCVFH
jgi:hypothetical protein